MHFFVRFSLSLLILAGSTRSAGADATALPLGRARAHAEYEAKTYAACGQTYSALAKAAPQRASVGHWYSAACCFALAGQTDEALTAIENGVAAGEHDADQLQQDTDLASLRASPRFVAAVAKAKQRAVELNRAKLPALQRELKAMYAVDQAVRMSLMADVHNKTLAAKLAQTDRRHTKRLKAIVKRYGWPGFTLVGHDGADAAFWLVQHADLDVPFQKAALRALEQALKANEVEPFQLAYLTDRIAVAEHEKQTYGTQFAGEYPNLTPQPIADAEHCDVRRAAIGLESLSEYKAQMLEMLEAAQASK